MKKIFLPVFVLLITSFTSNAQFGNIIDRAKQKAKDKVNQKVDQKMDKAIGGAVDSVDNTVSGKKTKPANSGGNKDNNTGAGAKDDNNGASQIEKAEPASLKSYSKFDFVPGEKIIAAEDFTQDAVGDFPAKWNTNGSGEIVTTNKKTGKFLMVQKDVVFYPEWIKDLPDNFTLEFDLMCTDKFSFYSGYFIAGFTSAVKIGDNFRPFARFGDGRIADGGGFEVAFHPENAGGNQGLTHFYSSLNEKEVLRNESDQDRFSVPEKTFVHISVWRQKTRLRVYLDDKKVWDLPKAISEGLKLNSLYFRNDGSANENDAYYLANVRLAVGAPDTRNKLITEGKFITHGILFDINSDKIKPESYGTLKDIANVLVENADVKVKIIGHTDTDGDDASNLSLSKKRAEAVKAALNKEFFIDASRISTDGKGESQPVDVNTTTAGKANNRRVEFIKE
jgi:OOP family OmpA-OmpF porin